jgi:hypothetical protein
MIDCGSGRSQVCLKAPAGKESWAPCVGTTAIFLTESRPPAGEAPVEWLLLSSRPVTTLAKAVETVKWYLCRWEIEVYFRIYKSGCRVERLQLEISEHLEPALALYMIIAWRIQSIVLLLRAGDQVLLLSFFTPAYRLAAALTRSAFSPGLACAAP